MFNISPIFDRLITMKAVDEKGVGINKGWIMCEGDWVRSKDEGKYDQDWYQTDARGAVIFETSNTYMKCHAKDKDWKRSGSAEFRNISGSNVVKEIVIR